jgi:hypothetical protein
MVVNLGRSLLLLPKSGHIFPTGRKATVNAVIRRLYSTQKKKSAGRHEPFETIVAAMLAGSMATAYINSAHRQPRGSQHPLKPTYLLSTRTAKAEPQRSKGARNVMLHRKRSKAGRDLHSKYKVDWKTVIGEGAYGSVYPARLASTGEKVALKKISKRYTNSSAFRKETEALLRIYDNGGHPNISGLRDMYEDNSFFYLILDLIKGGEMFEHLSKEGAYSEADSARLIFEVASALAFLHGGRCFKLDVSTHIDFSPEFNQHDPNDSWRYSQ